MIWRWQDDPEDPEDPEDLKTGKTVILKTVISDTYASFVAVRVLVGGIITTYAYYRPIRGY
jgi:hypothetical protein